MSSPSPMRSNFLAMETKSFKEVRSDDEKHMRDLTRDPFFDEKLGVDLSTISVFNSGDDPTKIEIEITYFRGRRRRTRNDHKKLVDISRQLFILMNDILCLVAFGKRFIDEEAKAMGQTINLQEVMTEVQALLTGLCVADFFPGWGWLSTISGFKRRLMKARKNLMAVCDEIIEEHLERKKNGKIDSSREDFVDVLLKVQQHDNLEVPITMDNIKTIVLDMFVAGTDTSAATLAWTMTELARHPKVMQKAQAQVREIACGKGRVDEDHLPHLPYLRAIIKESMRLHPPGPLLLPRETMETCTLSGFEIPKKTRLIFNYYAITRDPKSWKNPLEFNPERFIESDIDVNGQDSRYLPFGGGRRICPGRSFAMVTMEIALAKLLYHFDWVLPKGLGAEDIDLSEEFGLATKKKTALILVPIANKDYEYKGISQDSPT